MKSLFAILFLFVFIVSMNSSLMAQNAQGNVFVVTNFERAFPDNGSARELDSLTTLYIDKCFGADNEYVVSCKVLRHWWGHDNRDFIQIVEVKNWNDVVKANEKANDLFMKAWPTKEDRKKFNDANNKYFTGKHSDEIYNEVVFN
ncbi:MAG: hypothetical protein OQJ93_12295 [Ignavibacteriaceae bacterium]|nr:hypothetical protein [Chlorobium sp.]MCW8816815.1 hypothetical protein [Ignavibacteriaceae bacterium]MCW8994990.1 hypothetical protein [Psychromonas sp.]MCW8823838.1 hypothetical protein [Ignavibacteriaceae bacterium]MCW8960136.1 hypothetical protein [Ignavibacteriaceae bacterium]